MNYESYTLFLCLLVYVGLVALFTVMVTMITKQSLKLMRAGVDDEKIKTEYLKNKDKKPSVILGVINLIIPIIACVIMIVLFVGSIVVGALSDNVVGDVPVMKVVSSASMSTKYEKNKYLFDNDLNDQLQVYDVIFAHKLPDEMDLKQYDIVVYEVDGNLLIHRIVNIEEPNEKHPNERYFLLQGDSVQYPDKFPVKYSQMKGIYRGERIPFLGSFVVFLQSTAGVLCMMLVVFASFAMPFIEKKFKKEKQSRLVAMGVINADGSEVVIVEQDQTEQISTEQVSDGDIVLSPTDEPSQVIDDNVQVDENVSASEVEVEQEFIANPVEEVAVTSVDEPAQVIEQPTEQLEEVVAIDDKEDVEELSDVEQKEVEELVQSGLTQEEALEKVKWYHSLAGKKGLTFRQKRDMATEEVLSRYNKIANHLKAIKGVRIFESKTCETYKKGRTPICKIAFKGKSFSVYLALNPSEYENTKYFYTETTASSYKDYSMRVKVTSHYRPFPVANLLFRQRCQAGRGPA